jgi:hypothetical protein
MRIQTPYDSNTRACEETYATLRIMHASLDPDEVTKLLGIEPTETQRVGDSLGSIGKRKAALAGWFLCTKGVLSSRDVREHLDRILDEVRGSERAFREFHARGYEVDFACKWVSAKGHGGPILSPPQLCAIGALGAEVWFDVYVGEITP